MINYRVENLEALAAQLKNEGATIVDKIEDADYGKFVHILDMEGNKIQLWEPKDYDLIKMLLDERDKKMNNSTFCFSI